MIAVNSALLCKQLFNAKPLQLKLPDPTEAQLFPREYRSTGWFGPNTANTEIAGKIFWHAKTCADVENLRLQKLRYLPAGDSMAGGQRARF